MNRTIRRSLFGVVTAICFALIAYFLLTALYFSRDNLSGSSVLTLPAAVPINMEAHTTKGKTVQLCELIATPDAYNGKTVRVEAFAVATFEQSFLYDPSCNRRNDWVYLQFENSSVLEKVTPFADFSHGRNAPRRAKIIMLGRFTASPTARYGHLESFRFNFVAFEVEKAEAVSDAVPQPWPANASSLLSARPIAQLRTSSILPK